MYTYNEYTPLTAGGDYMGLDEDDYYKRGSSGKIVLFLLILALGGGAFWLFGTDSGSSLIGGGSESGTGSNAYANGGDGGSGYSSRSEALSRASSAVGTAINTTKDGYKMTVPGFIAYAYNWAYLKNSSNSSAINTLLRYTTSCDKSKLTEGDLLIDDALDFAVIFNGWTNPSTMDEYNLMYMSEGSKKIVSTSFEYPFLKNPETDKPWRNVVPRCIKASYIGSDSSSGSGGSSSNGNNGPCSLSSSSCWKTQVENHKWSSDTLVDHFDLHEFTKYASVSDDNKATFLKFAYELEAVWQYWNLDDGFTWHPKHAGYDSSHSISIVGFNPSAKTVKIKPGGGRYSVFAQMLIDGWKDGVKSSTSGVTLTLGNRGFQPVRYTIAPKLNSSSYTGSASTHFKCGMNDYGCWKAAAQSLTWTRSTSIAKDFVVSEFISVGLSSSVLTSVDLQATLLRFVSQIQKVKDDICSVLGCSVKPLYANFSTTGTSTLKISAVGQTNDDWFAEQCRRMLPGVTIITGGGYDAPQIALPKYAPEFNYRGYSRSFSRSSGLTPKYANYGFQDPIRASGYHLVSTYLEKRSSTSYHGGIDLAGPTGNYIYPVYPGTVIASERHNGGYGNVVYVEHNVNGNYMLSVYGHMSERLVKKYDEVKLNTPLGKIGSTGHSSGPHLHLDITYASATRGTTVNELDYVSPPA